MRMMRLFLAPVLIAASMIGGDATPAHSQGYKPQIQHSPWLALRIEQDGKQVLLDPADTILTEVALKHRPFTIVLPVRGDDDVYRITAWRDDSIFTAVEKAKRSAMPDRGRSFEPPQYFTKYTAMADTAAGSGTLMLNPEAHHYLSGLRLGPDYYRHVFHVSTVLARDASDENREFTLDEIDGPLYLVAWYDEDGDEKMSHGEYEFLMLNFK